jgi:hypothetical protein
MATYCPKCGQNILSIAFCPKCDSTSAFPAPSVPGVQAPKSTPIINPLIQNSPEFKLERKRQFRRSYRITLIGAVFYFVMDLVLNNTPEANHVVDEPWPFIFQFSRILAFFTFIITLIVRSKAPMLYFVWSVTIALAVRTFAVIQRYGIETVTLTQWIWTALGFFLVASFWILKYGVHNRIRNW